MDPLGSVCLFIIMIICLFFQGARVLFFICLIYVNVYLFIFRVHVFDNGTLVLYSAGDEDAGTYKCLGVSQSGRDQAFTAQLLLACKYHHVLGFSHTERKTERKRKNFKEEAKKIKENFVSRSLSLCLNTDLGSLTPSENQCKSDVLIKFNFLFNLCSDRDARQMFAFTFNFANCNYTNY